MPSLMSRSTLALTCVVTSALAAIALAQPPAAPASTGTPLDAATIERWMTELSNWNRWGKDDQRGTVNLMTDATRKAAIATVKEGVSVSLSRDTDTVQSADNGNPLGLAMVATAQAPDPFAMETLTITFHGSAYTHMDALSHMFHKGQTYNGAPQSLIGATGASRNTVTAFKSGFVGRGVLMDIPRAEGRPLPRAADRDHRRRSRRLGEAGRPQGRQRRHRLLPHRPLDAAGQGRRLGHRRRERWPASGAWRAG